jgi:uncharacterized protein involved in exopolysaccharide biosynthesis
MENQTFPQNGFSIIEFLLKYQKIIGIIALLAIVTSAIFSSPFFIKPKYQSTVVFFPARSASISNELLNTDGGSKSTYLEFGEEDAADQLVQILQSEEIREKIIQKFHLLEHYEIDSTAPLKNYYLNTEYEKNISFRRTEYLSVEIKVLDTDPKIAAEIANEIARLLDETKSTIIHHNAKEALKIVESQYFAKKILVDSIKNQLTNLRKLGIYDYETQVDHLTGEQVRNATELSSNQSRLQVLLENGISKNDTSVINTKARIKGSESALKTITETMTKLENFGSDFNLLNSQFVFESEELSRLAQRYSKALVDAQAALNVKFIVNDAKAAEKKTYPVRWLIVLISTVGSLVFTIMALVIWENILRYRKQKTA